MRPHQMFIANKTATPAHQALIRLLAIGKTPVAHAQQTRRGQRLEQGFQLLLLHMQ